MAAKNKTLSWKHEHGSFRAKPRRGNGASIVLEIYPIDYEKSTWDLRIGSHDYLPEAAIVLNGTLPECFRSKRSRPKSRCPVHKADRRTPEFRLFSVATPICEVNNTILM